MPAGPSGNPVQVSRVSERAHVSHGSAKLLLYTSLLCHTFKPLLIAEGRPAERHCAAVPSGTAQQPPDMNAVCLGTALPPCNWGRGDANLKCRMPAKGGGAGAAVFRSRPASLVLGRLQSAGWRDSIVWKDIGSAGD